MTLTQYGYQRSLRLLAPILLVCLCAQLAFAQVVTYSAPSGVSMSGDYIVKVGGKNIPVYRSGSPGALPQPAPYDKTTDLCSFATFDFSGSAQVEITSPVYPLGNAVVRPASKGVVPSVTGGVMRFTVTKAFSHLSIEPNGKHQPLLLFANPIDVNVPAPDAPGVVYLGPGLHKGLISLSSNQTLYLAGGAVLQGGVFAKGKGITIRGRGIVDGLPAVMANKGPQVRWYRDAMVCGQDCTNLRVEGIILKDAFGSAVTYHRCIGVTTDNIKIVGDQGDGFHNFNTGDLHISDCFIRTDDDCVYLGVSWAQTPLTDIVTMTRCSLWTNRANIWRIGSGWQQLGVPSPSMRNLTFTNIDVLHYDTYPYDHQNPVARIGGNKDQNVEHVRFENIRINREGQSELWEVKTYKDTNTKISDCYFKDIFVTGAFNETYGAIRVGAIDALSAVSDVTFENIMRHGQLTLETSPGVHAGSNTSNITFIGSTTAGNLPPTISRATNGK